MCPHATRDPLNTAEKKRLKIDKDPSLQANVSYTTARKTIFHTDPPYDRFQQAFLQARTSVDKTQHELLTKAFF